MRVFVLAFMGVVSLAACAPKPSVTVTVTPPEVLLGESAQVSWHVTPGTLHCRLNPDQGLVEPDGVITVTPHTTVDFIIDCGDEIVGDAFLRVRKPTTIIAFSATPTMAVPDQPIHLSWSTRWAQKCALGPVVPAAVPQQGSVDTMVSTTTTFTLDCTGFEGAAHAEATVEVTPVDHLDVPTALAVTPFDGALQVSWVQSPGAANVFVAKNPDAGVSERSVYRKVTSPFTISGLVNEHTYFLRVSAVSGEVESAVTDELSATPHATPLDDPLFSKQWHLLNTGQEGGTPGEDINVVNAWAQGRGEGVRIAIVDEGVDLGHVDLRQNVATMGSHDYLGLSSVALAQHGTCVAGLVAARDLNGVGTRGTAPRASFVSYNVLQSLTSENQGDAMRRGVAENSISNNSWGANDGDGLLAEPDPIWLEGIATGVMQGRGGKGVVYFWAAGNGGDSAYLDNSNYDGQANSRFTLAIGGVGDDGVLASYSEQGANVLVVAPTEGARVHALTTTDITGDDGYNFLGASGEIEDVDYTQLMNGTSASTPVAAGVGALVLQANPALTWRDVRRVLALSARKNDATDADWVLNGAGHEINHKYGFGVVDAAAAVRLAKRFEAGASERSWSSGLLTPNAEIPDGVGSLVVPLDVAGSGVGQVEFVEIRVASNHPATGDLEITLEHEGGASSRLHASHACADDRRSHRMACSSLSKGFTFGSVRHLDEPGDGRWQLRVRDASAPNAGLLTSWQLTLWGRP